MANNQIPIAFSQLDYEDQPAGIIIGFVRVHTIIEHTVTMVPFFFSPNFYS
jgi:hypothetical protein